MYHDLVRDASFWLFLTRVDQDLAETARAAGLPVRRATAPANYPRKPRGGPDDLPVDCRYRLSFCCERDGCRKTSDASVGPLSRSHEFISARSSSWSPPCGKVPRRDESGNSPHSSVPTDGPSIVGGPSGKKRFPLTTFWKVARGRLVPTVEVDVLPRSLLDAFVRNDQDRDGWKKLLLFLSPITITGGLKIEGCKMTDRSPAEDA